MGDADVDVLPAQAGIRPDAVANARVVPAQAGIRHARLLLVAVAAVIAGCDPAPQDDTLFPLAAGHRWTYRITTHRDDQAPQVESITLATRGPQRIGDAPAWRRHADSGIDYWLRSDSSGIYRVASKRPLEREPRPDEPPRYVLRAPYAVGTQWRGSTTAYVLERRNEVPRQLSRSHPSIPIAYRIDALDQRVETPAGRFDGCLRVQGRAEVRLYIDATRTYGEVPLLGTEWYCPGVGLVRLERNEASPSKLLLGGTLVMELTAWQ